MHSTSFDHGICLYLVSGFGSCPGPGIGTGFSRFAVPATGGQSATGAQSGATGSNGGDSARACRFQSFHCGGRAKPSSAGATEPGGPAAN